MRINEKKTLDFKFAKDLFFLLTLSSRIFLVKTRKINSIGTLLIWRYNMIAEKATSQLLLEPDWDSILQICDAIRQGDVT